MPINTKNTVPHRLINEKSPYLLQHAFNPVDWWPWCDEAFAKAKAEDKPIFLSIGYSTCHWCHVMARESFADEEIADILNNGFISIKVDREERPDIDHIYMNVCQLLTGSGGWPLSIFMDADQKPFFAGTYFPKQGNIRMTGLMDLLKQINVLWKTDKKSLDHASNEIIKALKHQDEMISTSKMSEEVIKKAVVQIKERFDTEYGGFNNAPKFPIPHNLMFLLRYYTATKDSTVLEMVEKTLNAMRKGGIYDHIGFGFSRYATDRRWLTPHFEKMLYDNALLVMAYAEAYAVTKNNVYKKIACDTLTYLMRDMTSPSGGFYSAEDADSQGVEGKFYVWSKEEIERILGLKTSERFCRLYDISAKGNFEEHNIPNLIHADMDENDQAFASACIQLLFAEREKRIHPHKDKKILTAWNGLAIAAFAVAGRVFENSDYINAAKKAVDFIYDTMFVNGRLYAGYCDGQVLHEAFAEDYSFLTWGLLALYVACCDEPYLQKALALSQTLVNEFWDDDSAGIFMYGNKSEPLLTRPKEIYDGAVPSANSVCIDNFIQLSRLTGRSEWEEKAMLALDLFAAKIARAPMYHTFSLMAFLEKRWR